MQGDHLVMLAGRGAGAEVEVPPFRAQGHPTGMTHHAPEELAVAMGCGRKAAGRDEGGLTVDVGGRRHVVYLRAHRQRVATGIAECDVHGHTVVVHTSSMGGIGDVDVARSVFHTVPHLLLYLHGAGGIVDFQAEVGTKGLQKALGFAQGLRSLGVEESLTEVVIERHTAKIVGPGIHQTHLDGAVGIFHVDIALTLKGAGGLAQRMPGGARRWGNGLGTGPHPRYGRGSLHGLLPGFDSLRLQWAGKKTAHGSHNQYSFHHLAEYNNGDAQRLQTDGNAENEFGEVGFGEMGLGMKRKIKERKRQRFYSI